MARSRSTPRIARAAESGHEGRTILLDLRRILQVVWACGKFGLFPLAGLLPILPVWRKPFAMRVRLALEELGLTYVKFGQYLAMRYDVVPADICTELARLYDRIPGMPFDRVRRVIEEEFGRPLEDLFPVFAPEPIAAASVGQVHEARLPSGHRVAVKVQRTGLRPIFLSDINNFRRVASLLDASGLAGQLSMRLTVDEFARWTLREFDFTLEGHAADRLRETAEPFVLIPKVYWELTSPRVLTMEFITGISAAEAGDLLAAGGEELVRTRVAGFDVNLALHRFTQASLGQFLTAGYFHADAHPGNIFFCDSNVIVFLDFGIVGSLTEAESAIVKGQIINMALGNISESIRYFTLQLISTENTDLELVRQQCQPILRGWYVACQNVRTPVQERHLARYLGDMIEVCRQNGLYYCLNYLLFWRALNSLNSTAWRVDPQFDVLKELRAYFEATEPGPFQQAHEIVASRRWNQTQVKLAAGGPRRFDAALTNLTRGHVSWRVGAEEEARERTKVAGHIRWLTAAVFLIALAVLTAVSQSAWLVGLVLAGVVILGLVSALRRRR